MTSTDTIHDLTGLIEGFLAGYGSAATRAASRSDLSLWSAHGQSRRLQPLQVRRGDIEGYARRLEATGLAPATVNRRPRRPAHSPRQALSRTEMKDWLDPAEAEGGQGSELG